MPHIDYVIGLTGSRFFDTVLIMRAKELAKEHPEVNVEVERDKQIRISGDVTEEGAEKVEELQYVRIIAVSNANGTNIEDAIGDESRMASTLTFLADYTQAARMIELEIDGPMHIVLVSRGDAKEAKKLLAEQDEILERIAIEKEMQEAESESAPFPFETEVP